MKHLYKQFIKCKYVHIKNPIIGDEFIQNFGSDLSALILYICYSSDLLPFPFMVIVMLVFYIYILFLILKRT